MRGSRGTRGLVRRELYLLVLLPLGMVQCGGDPQGSDYPPLGNGDCEQKRVEFERCVDRDVPFGDKCEDEACACIDDFGEDGKCFTREVFYPLLSLGTWVCSCECRPKPAENGAVTMTVSTWRPTVAAPPSIPPPGGRVAVGLELSPLSEGGVIEFGSFVGGGAEPIRLLSGALSLEAWRRSAAGETHLLDLRLVDGHVVADSFSHPPYLDVTGPNTFELQSLTGTWDLTTQELRIAYAGVVHNDLWKPSAPMHFSAHAKGYLDPAVGAPTLLSYGRQSFYAVGGLFGSGCPGAGGRIPTISTSGGDPVPGNASFAIELGNALGGTLAVLAVGTSLDEWRGLELPLDLAAATQIGCYLNVPPERTVSVWTEGLGPGQGRARVPFPIPSDPGLVGQLYYFQWGVIDPTAGAAAAALAGIYPGVTPRRLTGVLSQGLKVRIL